MTTAKASTINRPDASPQAEPEECNPRWKVVDGLTLSTWPDEDEAIVYLGESGDMHWLSGAARSVIETLREGEGEGLTEEKLYQAITPSMPCDKDDVAEHYIPYLFSLGLIYQVKQ